MNLFHTPKCLRYVHNDSHFLFCMCGSSRHYLWYCHHHNSCRNDIRHWQAGCRHHRIWSDIRIAVKEVLRAKQDLYEILSYHTGQTVQQLEKDAQRDFWMSSEEAKEYGLIDQVISREKK